MGSLTHHKPAGATTPPVPQVTFQDLLIALRAVDCTSPRGQHARGFKSPGSPTDGGAHGSKPARREAPLTALELDSFEHNVRAGSWVEGWGGGLCAPPGRVQPA